MLYILFEKKGQKRGTRLERKKLKEKRAKKQANSQLAQT